MSRESVFLAEHTNWFFQFGDSSGVREDQLGNCEIKNILKLFLWLISSAFLTVDGK